MRFHIRAMYEDGTPVIIKQEAEDIYEAVALAGRQARSAGNVNVKGLLTLRVRPLTTKSSAVYVGQKPARKGKPRNKSTNGSTPAETKAETPAVKAPADAGKPAERGEKAKAGK